MKASFYLLLIARLHLISAVLLQIFVPKIALVTE